MMTPEGGPAADRCAERLLALAGLSAEGTGLALTCIPPLQLDPFPYGDLVPLGFLLLALRGSAARGGPSAARGGPGAAERAGAVEEHLRRQRQGALWSYHRGGQVTSIDSALILLGLEDAGAVSALEELRAPDGGYVPQPWTASGEPGRMPLHDAVRHWCQPDLTIACLVRFLRRRHGLGETVPLAALEQGFERRSGLYIANPWLVDWFYALALGGGPEGATLRERLAGEILAGAGEDGTFGAFDPLLSTAAAVLALAELGVPRRAYAGAVAFLEREVLRAPDPPAACPFYSTRREEWDRLPVWELLGAFAADARKQLIRVAGQPHTITFYEDRAGAVTTPLVALALFAAGRGQDGEARCRPPAAPPHGRYRCAQASEYVQAFALPPYLEPSGGPDVSNREE
jgi:hypothetical protein